MVGNAKASARREKFFTARCPSLTLKSPRHRFNLSKRRTGFCLCVQGAREGAGEPFAPGEIDGHGGVVSGEFLFNPAQDNFVEMTVLGQSLAQPAVT